MGSARRTRASGRAEPLPRRRRRPPDLPDLIAAACALPALLLYLGILAWRLPELVEQWHWNSDYVISELLAPVFPSLGGRITLPSDTYLDWMLFDRATLWLPGHRAIQEAAPVVVAMAIPLLLAALGRLVAGRRAALLIALTGLGMTPFCLSNQMAQDIHAVTILIATCLLGFLVLLVEGRLGEVSGPAAVALASLLAALGLVSDPMLLVIGLMPLTVVAAGMWLLLPELRVRLAAGALPVLLLAPLGAMALGRWMASAGVRVLPLQRSGLAPPGQVVAQVQSLFDGLFRLAGGPSSNLAETGVLPLPFAGAALALAVLAATVVGPFAALLQARAHGRRAGERGGAAGRVAFLGFTSLAGGLTAAAFVLTGISDHLVTARLLVPLFYGGIGALGVLASARTPAFLAATVLGGLGCVSSALGLATFNYPYALPSVGAALSRLEAEGLRHGYAGYWDAASATYQSQGRMTVRAVTRCHGGAGPSLCAHAFNAAEGWYRPSGDRRTFLIVDPDRPYLDFPPPPDLGPPEQELTVGRIHVYVFPYDLATRLGPPVL